MASRKTPPRARGERRSNGGRRVAALRADVVQRLRATAGPLLARPRVRLGLFAGLAVTLLVVLGVQGSGIDAPPEIDRPALVLDEVVRVEPEGSAAVEAGGAQDTPVDGRDALPLEVVPADQAPAWDYVQVASGDTLDLIFRRMGLPPALLHRIVTLDEHGAGLADLRPGDELAFDIDEDGAFRALRAEKDDETWLYFELEKVDAHVAEADPAGSDLVLVSRLEPRDLDVRTVEIEAEITSSLFAAGKNAGLSDNMILRLANIFGWDIDFALDIRRGDRFALVFEEIYRDGQFLRQGAILAARFVNRGETFQAIRFDAGDGPDYYSPDGRPMRKAFLRAPINFTRVSSNYNPRRLHPVTRRIRPHNGTDYAAPTGTPIWAAGDGTVIEAGYSRPNGNYIFIQHGNHIVTRYLHLSRKRVNRGDRVRQGQVIGNVGSTGLATGPHLHYEFLVNGRHRDPRRVDLPEATPLSEELLPSFRAHAAPYLAQLDRLVPDAGVMLASAGDGGCAERDAGCRSGNAP
ncbi:peptidoglycan DD-metalloendopeptidase family protein [Halomonas denitrificans]|nr:peptidoglycan DD-metalloendopeptidase family protein [Halomonas denitrificans]